MYNHFKGRLTVTALILVVSLTFTTIESFAQSDGYNTNSNLRGVVPFGTYQFGEIDNVNLASGTVNLRIPIATRQGRGSSETSAYVYSSKIWVTRPILDPIYPYDWRNGDANIRWLAWEPTSELHYVQGVIDGPRGTRLEWTENWYTCTYVGAYGYPYTYNVIIRSNFSLGFGDGTNYQFPNRKVTKDQQYPDLSQCITPMAGPPPPPADERQVLVGYSNSNTMELDITGTNFLVRHKDGSIASYNGTQVGPSFQWYKDSDGNILDSNGDTLKRSGMRASDGSVLGGSAVNSVISLSTQFPTTGDGCVYQYQGSLDTTTSLTLPNGQQFTFQYDPVFGELTRVNLPTGGYIRYVYQTLAEFDDAPTGNNSCVGVVDSRRVVERRVSADGITEQVWTYQYIRDVQTGETRTQVTDPVGNVSVHWFSGQYESKTELLNSAGLPVRRTVNYWGGDSGPTQLNQDGTRQMGGKNARIISTVTTLLDSNQVSKTETDYDQFTYQIDQPPPYNNVTESRMNVTETREYDFGVGNAGPLVRRTTFTYNTATNYLSRHIWGLLETKQVHDGGGNLKAQSQTLYDTLALTATSGVVQHDYTNYGSGMIYRGNPTESKVWRSTDGTWLTSKSWYDDLGNVVQSQDPLGHNTYLSYADSWTTALGGNTCAPVGGTARAFVTQVTNHLSQVASTKYFSCSSLVGSTTDPNNQTSTFAYDIFDRPVSATRPDGGSTTWSFDDFNRKATSSQTIGNGVSPLTAEYYYDGLWRVFESRLTSDPQGTVYTVVEFDELGRIKKAWNPTRCSSPKTNNCENTWGITELVYDELGRTIKVIPPDGTAISNNVTTTYSGNTVTVTDQAGKQRRSYTDALGRLIQVDEPGPGGGGPAAAGTGSATVSGSLQISSGSSAAPGAGWVDISGTEQSITDWVYVGDECVMYGEFGCEQWQPVYEPQTTWDTGGVSITVNGLSKSVTYGLSSTASGIAVALANAINADSGYPVSASVSGARVNLTSKASGAATNYSLSSSAWTDYPGFFASPSFTATRSGPTLTGGADGTPTVYDLGSVWVTVNGLTKTVGYGQGSSSSSVASALASAINGDAGYPVSASLGGSTINLTAKTTGSGTNYPLSGGSSTSQPGTFAGPSFTVSTSGLSGGADATPVTYSLATPAVTTYTYDALDNLLTVVQSGSRQRTFTYSSLSQLLTANNPESGLITYSYDADGNLITKTDARGITITHAYDELHRLTLKTYSDASLRFEFYYDESNPWGWPLPNTIGRLSRSLAYKDSTFVACEHVGYDAMGRTIHYGQCRPSGGYDPLATYDLAGNLTELTYPSGRKVTYGYDAASRLNRVSFDSFSGTPVNYNYLSNATYHPHGAPKVTTLGSGFVETTTYNSRLRPLQMTGVTGAFTYFNKQYNFYDGSNRNNGNVMRIADQLNTGRSQNFTYDALNRLDQAYTDANSGTDCWGLAHGYDIWANLLSASVTKCSAPMLSVSVNTQNRITNPGFSYDAAGNLLTDGSHSYQWDAESRMKSLDTTGASYTYDAAGMRVRKDIGSDSTEYIYFGGNVIAERAANGDWSDYIYAGGRRLAKADTFEERIRIWGTNCSDCGSQWAHFFFPSAGGLNGYVIQSGDKLYWRQWQGNAARGGTNVWFTDGSSTAYTTLDQDGQPINADTYMNAWHYRRVDLSAHAGKTVNNLSVVNEGYNAGFWDIYYQDIALVSADGTVRAIWSRRQTVSLTASPSGGMTGIGYEVNHVSGAGQWPQVTTQYYHGDHLGSSRMMTAYEGYPTWSATYLPFGQEHNPQPTSNHYKFTGKERDTESSLDYFGVRYYSSAQGRFLSPDEFAGGPIDAFSSNDPLPPGPLPYADITDPQSLNKYVYAQNNPLRFIDPDGHGLRDFIRQTILGASTAFLQDNGIDVPTEGNSVGRAIGHIGALTQGLSEIVAGAAGAAAGAGEALVTAPAGTTGVGALVPAVGVAAVVTGVAVATHGGGVLSNTLNNIRRESTPKAGSSGGPGSGKRATPAQREGALGENGGKCVFCGKKATQVDHAVPRSRGGDTTKKNLQPTCAECNQQKGPKTTKEYLKWKKEQEQR